LNCFVIQAVVDCTCNGMATGGQQQCVAIWFRFCNGRGCNRATRTCLCIDNNSLA
jgi:hypothetical protein